MLSSCLAPYLYTGMGLFFPRGRTLHFLFVELQEVTVSPFLHHAQASVSATDASAATFVCKIGEYVLCLISQGH